MWHNHDMPTGRLPSLTNAKTLEKNIPIDALQGLAMAGKVPPTGVEQTSNPEGNKHSTGSVPPPVPPSGTINPELAELIELWNTMDATAQADLLTVARRSIGDQEKILEALGTVPPKPPKPVG